MFETIYSIVFFVTETRPFDVLNDIKLKCLLLFFRSPEWKSIPAAEKKKIDLVLDDDGEFWYLYFLCISLVTDHHVKVNILKRLVVPSLFDAGISIGRVR